LIQPLAENLSVLFVCTGNICRSPTAEGVFRELLRRESLESRVRVDSAGTHDYHVGRPPDPRATAHALRRGYDISGLRARQVVQSDFDAFDLVLAMDRGHLEFLAALCPPEHRHKLSLMLDFAGLRETDVPDPYARGPELFELVLDMAEAASRGLLDHVRNHLLRVST
jgi:protein-tyrosine phosphatase